MQRNAQNFYNENDPKAAAWLRCLIAEGLIPNGHVDERSIEEIEPDDVQGYAQCHWFAGIGGWSEALRLAAWPNDVPVWTGSCPCQPLSSAGKRAGEMDERHLWPAFYRLIAQCRPATVFGEQVASSDGLEWLDGVSLDLEELGYAIGAADLPAAGVGAPHRRQRLWWVADAGCESSQRNARAIPRAEAQERGQDGAQHGHCAIGHSDGGEAVSLADAYLPSENGRAPSRKQSVRHRRNGNRSRLEHATGDGRQQWRAESNWWGIASRCGSDGLRRRLEPGLEPLAARLPGRLDLIRGYGNAIVPQVAAKFIRAYLDSA